MSEQQYEGNVDQGEVFQGENDEWYWRGIAGNSEIVANSAPESYTRQDDALRAFESTFPGVPCKVITVFNDDTEEGGNSMSEQEGSAGNHPNAGPSGAEREGITASGPEGDEQGPGEGAKVNDPSQGDGGEHSRAGGANGEDGPTPEEEAEAQAEAEAAAEEAEASEHGI